MPTMNKYLEKIASRHHYYHTTSKEGLDRILNGNRIKSLDHVAKDTPDTEVEAETTHLPFIRERLRADEAVKKMNGIKDTSSIFLTKGRYLPNYGKYVVEKKLGNRYVKERHTFNSIPDEHITKRRLSARYNSTVYVPDDEVDAYNGQGVRVKPLSQLDGIKTSLTDRVMNYPAKAYHVAKHHVHNMTKKAEALPDGTKVHTLGRNAFLGGSSALGIATDNSDTDVFIPYKQRHHYERAVKRLQERFPGLKENGYSANKENKTVLTGKIDGKNEVDIALGFGEKPIAYAEAFHKAKASLTPEQKAKIIARKRELKNAWFFPEYRYKRYKKQLADELGLRQHYF